MNATPSYPQEDWLTESESLAYSDYWNNELNEQSKAFWILDGGFDKLEAHLRKTGLSDQLKSTLEAAERAFGRRIRGTGCDLAAGNLWATPQLLRHGADRVYSVEYSRHRLLKLGPAVLAHYGVRPDQAVLVLGNFERLHLADASLDFVLLSAAFHHSDHPGILLREIRRVLKPDGLVVIIGEHDADLRPRHYFTQPIKYVLSQLLSDDLQHRWFGRTLHTSRLLPDQRELLVTDQELGDHYYTRADYQRMFSEGGFKSILVTVRSSEFQAFALTPSNVRSLNAGER